MVPLGVRIYGAFHMLSGALVFLLGLAAPIAMRSFWEGLLFAVLLLPVGALDFVYGRGNWNGKGWARVLTIVFSALGVLGCLFAGEWLAAVPEAMIFYYFAMSASVRRAYG